MFYVVKGTSHTWPGYFRHQNLMLCLLKVSPGRNKAIDSRVSSAVAIQPSEHGLCSTHKADGTWESGVYLGVGADS